MTIHQPNITKKHLAEVGNASTQTVDEIASEKNAHRSEGEALDQVFFLKKEDILYQAVLCKKGTEGRDGG